VGNQQRINYIWGKMKILFLGVCQTRPSGVFVRFKQPAEAQLVTEFTVKWKGSSCWFSKSMWVFPCRFALA
jgi:hypothetical protein